MILFRKHQTARRRTRQHDDFLESLRKDLTAQWQEQSTRLLQEWMKEANQSLEKALSDALLPILQPSATPPSDTPLFPFIPPFNPQGNSTGEASLPFAGFSQSLGRVFSALLASRSRQRKTTIHSAETERSKHANQDFRLSHGQQQAHMAQAAAQGQRNL